MVVCGRCNTGYNEELEQECPECKEANKPFYRTKESQDKGIISIRLNQEERAALEDIKQVLDIGSDATALKLAAFKGWGVLQRVFGRNFLRWLSDRERQNRALK